MNFTPEGGRALRQAGSTECVVVSLAEGGGEEDTREEIFAITDHLRGARFTHPDQLVRQLASMPFQSGLRSGVSRADYERIALEAVSSATAIVAARAPRHLAAFRTFLVELALVAANAHKEGGFLGMGGVRVTAAEEAAIARIKRAAGVTQ